jgi:hypothetical protein
VHPSAFAAGARAVKRLVEEWVNEFALAGASGSMRATTLIAAGMLRNPYRRPGRTIDLPAPSLACPYGFMMSTRTEIAPQLAH